MPSAELLPAAVLKRKAVVYIRATATSSDRTLLSTKGEPTRRRQIAEACVEFAPDSPLEGSGFEPPVPHAPDAFDASSWSAC